MTRNSSLLAATAALSIALAGCIGSGSDRIQVFSQLAGPTAVLVNVYEGESLVATFNETVAPGESKMTSIPRLAREHSVHVMLDGGEPSIHTVRLEPISEYIQVFLDPGGIDVRILHGD